MNKTEYVWVIQIDDGKYLEKLDGEFTENLYCALFCNDIHLADYFILDFKLENCKPAKCEIRVIGEKDE